MTGVHAKSCHILWINVVLILLQPTNFKNHNMTEQSSSPDISYEACSYLDACWSILVNNDIKNPPGKCIFFKLICREMVLRFYGSTIWKIYFSLLKFLKCWLIWNYKSSARESYTIHLCEFQLCPCIIRSLFFWNLIDRNKTYQIHIYDSPSSSL